MARLGKQKVAPWPFISFHPLLFAAFLIVTAAQGAEEARGTLEIKVKDHREAIGDFAKLMLSIEAVAVSPNPGLRFWAAGWQDLAPKTDTVDLTLYTGGRSARIVRASLSPGAFDAMHLKLRRVEGVLKKTRAPAPVKNAIAPVKLAFEVRPQSETVVVLDLVVMDLSDHPPRGYELSVRGYEVYTNGKLVDKIPPGS